MTYTDITEDAMSDRDAEAKAWNAALASGDPAVIEQVRNETLAAVSQRIMDDDPNYAKAGWSIEDASKREVTDEGDQ